MFWKDSIKGLTTAASLWAVAAVGLSIGAGLYLPAVAATVLILIILALLKPLERRYFKKAQSNGMKLSLKPGTSLTILQDSLKKLNINHNLVNVQIEIDEEKEVVFLMFKSLDKSQLLDICTAIKESLKIEKIELID